MGAGGCDAPGDPTGLSPSEDRVAQLAACGMTNRDVAAALFISPKTVEANLGRIYHKLGIHSRAELGRLVGQSERYEGAGRGPGSEARGGPWLR